MFRKKTMVVFAALVSALGCAQERLPAAVAELEAQAPESIVDVQAEPQFADLLSDASPVTLKMVELLKPPPLSAISTVTTEPAALTEISQVRSLTFRVSVVGAAPGAGLAVEFTAPGNMVYERRVAALSGSAFDEQVAEFELPVAGTTIDSSGLAGVWTAKARIDGVEVTTRTFELTP